MIEHVVKYAQFFSVLVLIKPGQYRLRTNGLGFKKKCKIIEIPIPPNPPFSPTPPEIYHNRYKSFLVGHFFKS